MNRPRVFKDKHTLNSLVKLRQKGYSLHSLAFIFNVDFSSVYHHVKDIKSDNDISLTLPNILSTFQVDTTSILHLLDIHSRQLKSYADYLKEDRERSKYPNSHHIFRSV